MPLATICGHPKGPRSARGLCRCCYDKARRRGEHWDYERATRSQDELLDDYEMLRGQGLDWHQCAERLGMAYTAFERAMNRARSRGDRRARRIGERALPPPTAATPVHVRLCACGESFETTNKLRKYCRTACGDSLRYLVHRPEVPASHPTRCRCGKPLTREQRRMRRLYHSDACRAEFRRADDAARKREYRRHSLVAAA